MRIEGVSQGASARLHSTPNSYPPFCRTRSISAHRCVAQKKTPSCIAGPSRDTTMLTVQVRRTLHHAFCQGVLLCCFSSFLFAFFACLFILCFRPLSLSFLPLSPIKYLLSPLSLTFSSRQRRCVVSSVFACFHEYSCLANDHTDSVYSWNLLFRYRLIILVVVCKVNAQ